MLNHLKERFKLQDFPHEIGLFLGYPPKDVSSFIEEKGRHSLSIQYWKVYHDLEASQERFKRIDEVRRSAAALLLDQGYPVNMTIRLLRASAASRF